MASSEQLSQIHRNMDLPSRQKKAGEILYSIQKIVGQTLSDKYDLIIKQIKSIDVEEAFKTLPYKPCPFESKNPFATPDGGILQLKLDHYWFTLTISEHKSQGLRQNDT